MQWQTDKAFSDKFIPLIAERIGTLFIRPAPLLLDQKEATDLIVLELQALRFAVRVRNYARYQDRWDAYKWDVTIRSRRSSGVETEFHKILRGFADYFVYCWGLDDERTGPELRSFTMIKLPEFRFWCQIMGHKQETKYLHERANADGKTHFYVFDTRKLRAGVINEQWFFDDDMPF